MSDLGETSSERSPARFAVVGRVNKGKSSVLATLVEEADNHRLRIGPTPGETTRCQTIPLTLNGETLVEFIDTPGFNQARQALAWLREHHREE
ncbi:MAG: GTPase, partial [Verrucomicrobiales bacterium]